MSNTPYGGTPAGQTPWMPQGFPSQNPSPVPMIVALVLSLLALALAGAAWFRPTRSAAPEAPQYSAEQIADAKKNLCDAYDVVYRAAQRAGTATSDDPNQKYMVALNVRLVFNTSADHLFTVVNNNSAAPADLLNSTKLLASTYQKIVLGQSGDAPKEEMDANYADVDNADRSIKAACGK